VVAPTPRPVTATIADDENTTPTQPMYRLVIRNHRRQHQHATGALLVSQLHPQPRPEREGATMQFIFSSSRLRTPYGLVLPSSV
jgi:hypothetical protein